MTKKGKIFDTILYGVLLLAIMIPCLVYYLRFNYAINSFDEDEMLYYGAKFIAHCGFWVIFFISSVVAIIIHLIWKEDKEVKDIEKKQKILDEYIKKGEKKDDKTVTDGKEGNDK